MELTFADGLLIGAMISLATNISIYIMASAIRKRRQK